MKVLVVVGGQFGSEAKGHVAAQLARRELDQGRQVYAVRVAGHNAGHTAYSPLGRPFALRTIPAMAVVDDSIQLVIAAGSEVDPRVLIAEAEELESAGIPIWGRLYIDDQATIIEQDHIDQETERTMHDRLGSTGKGVGAARADRLMRGARTWAIWHEQTPWVDGELGGYHIPGCDTKRLWQDHPRDQPATLILEGTQGYGLGLHAGFYPYCTSSDCRTIDFLAMAGIDPRAWWVDSCHTWMVCRTFPIRVAGNSGPLENETSWEQLAHESGGYIKPEKTTVTKKVRRVGRWDYELVMDAFEANGGWTKVSIALTFADYIDPSCAGMQHEMELPHTIALWAKRNMMDLQDAVAMITTGPNTAVWL